MHRLRPMAQAVNRSSDQHRRLTFWLTARVPGKWPNTAKSMKARKPQIPSPKSYVIAVCLSAIFGVVGIQHFYMGRIVEGIIDFGMVILALFLFATGHEGWAIGVFIVDSIHTFVVTVMLLTGTFKDGQGRVICYPGQKLYIGENVHE